MQAITHLKPKGGQLSTNFDKCTDWLLKIIMSR